MVKEIISVQFSLYVKVALLLQAESTVILRNRVPFCTPYFLLRDVSYAYTSPTPQSEMFPSYVYSLFCGLFVSPFK